MAIFRGLAVGVALAGAAVGLAAPAVADLTDGGYTANYDIAGSHPWFITSCGAGCKSVQWNKGNASGTDTYHLNGNTWTVGPPTGKYNNVKTIDNRTLASTNEVDFMDTHIVERFQLVKKG